MAVTALGKLLRRLRVKNGEVLKDLAETLGVSSAFLSSIEHGKKAISKKMIDSIAQHYQLDSKEYLELIEAVELSKPVLNIDLKNAGEDDREIALAFARRLGSLKDEEKEYLKKVLHT